MNRSEFHYVDDPTVAVDDDGIIAVAWVDQSRKDIFFQSYAADGGTRLPAPVNVSRSPAVFSWLPRMLTGSGERGAVYLLWQEIVFSGGSHGGEIFFARSRDGGRTFDDPINLSNSIAGDGKGRQTRKRWHNGSLDLATAPDGTLYAAWTEYEGTLWLSRSSDAGKRFSTPMRIAGGSGDHPARGPSLAVGADGTVYLAWAVGEDRTADIHMTLSDDAGWSVAAPWVPVDNDAHADAPKISVDDAGTVHLVYAESTAGPSGRYRIRYSRSRDRGRTFDPPRGISSPLADGVAGAAFPDMRLDRNNNLYVVWERFPTAGGRPRGLGFTYSVDAGHSFAPAAVVPGSADPELGDNGSRQGLLMRKLAVNATGALAVVNSTFRAGAASRIWLFRGRRDVPDR